MTVTLKELRLRFNSNPPLRDQAYTALKDAILSGRFEPGERLVEQQIADSLGLSRNPVREAFRRLEQEGYLVATRTGMSVRGVNLEDVHDLYVVRERLEGMAAALAAERASAQDVETLHASLDEMEMLLVEGDLEKLTRASFEFHRQLYSLLGNRFLIDILTMLAEQLRRYRSLAFKVPHRGLVSIQEHRAVVQAMAQHDSAQADRLAQEHVRNSWEYANRLAALQE